MICNGGVTIYHKTIDEDTKLEKWIRYNYPKAWFFGGKGASFNRGFENANDVKIRIPYKENDNLDVTNFSIGDLIVKGIVTEDIKTQRDLSNYTIYNIRSINDNDFGRNPHIHIGGK